MLDHIFNAAFGLLVLSVAFSAILLILAVVSYIPYLLFIPAVILLYFLCYQAGKDFKEWFYD